MLSLSEERAEFTNIFLQFRLQFCCKRKTTYDCQVFFNHQDFQILLFFFFCQQTVMRHLRKQSFQFVVETHIDQSISCRMLPELGNEKTLFRLHCVCHVLSEKKSKKVCKINCCFLFCIVGMQGMVCQ